MNYSMKENGDVEFEVNSLYEALSVLAKLGGEDTPEGMAEWVKHRARDLQSGLGLKGERMPHAVTFRRIWGRAIDIEEFEQEVGSFFKKCRARMDQLALDEKTMRGTIESGQTQGVHLLALYAVGAGVVLNQVNVFRKENEISAAPRVLDGVALEGQVVSGDAMFTQRSLSRQIVESGGHYLWKVKDNQPTLHADIERLFAPEYVPLGSAPLRTDFQSITTTTKAHGRLETHTLTTSTLLNDTTDWPYLGQVFQLKRAVRYLKTGKTRHEIWYGITSLPSHFASPSRLLDLNRRHWAIENQLHYCRDVTFHENACQLAIGHAPQAIAILNNLVLGLLRARGFTAIAAALPLSLLRLWPLFFMLSPDFARALSSLQADAEVQMYLAHLMGKKFGPSKSLPYSPL